MKRIFTIVFAALVGIFTINLSTVAYAADAKEQVCQGIKQVIGDKPGASDDGCNDEAGVNNLVSTIISVLSWIMGVVAVIMIIIGSFKYITSGGDSGKVASAKNTIIYALVGLAIATLSQVLVRFVLSNAK